MNRERLIQWLVTYGNYNRIDLVGLTDIMLITIFDEEGTGEDARTYFS